MYGCLSCVPHWGPGLQPRHVPWLGIELATFWFTGLRSVHCTTPARPPTVLTYPTKFDGFLFGATVDPANHFYYDTCITLALFFLVRCHILLRYNIVKEIQRSEVYSLVSFIPCVQSVRHIPIKHTHPLEAAARPREPAVAHPSLPSQPLFRFLSPL